MKVCDLCKSEKCFKVSVPVFKEEAQMRLRAGKKAADKVIIRIELDLCESCLTKFNQELGHFIANLRKASNNALQTKKERDPTLEESTVKKAE